MTQADLIADLYQEHRQALYSLALALLKDPALAEDAVHDGIQSMLSLNRDLEGDPTAYLFVVVRNAALDLARRRKVRLAQQAHDNLFDSRQPDPLLRASDADAARRLREAINELTPEQQEVIILRALGRLGIEQIASVVGAPFGTVAARYSRAVAALRRELQEVSS
ncbi:MAG: sigma-70 family RNA polymerase sigma factor [Phycisphaerales bacterium]